MEKAQKNIVKAVNFIDAFKKNNAPRIQVIDKYGNERYVWDSSAYTDAYMIRSDKTNQLCRWIVELENGKQVSLYSYYGIKSSKPAYKKVISILAKMSESEKIVFVKNVFHERFETESQALDFLEQYYYVKYANLEPERYALVNQSLGLLAFVLTNRM